MDYSNAPVSALLRGPLLFTPQGWVVLASLIGYFGLALCFALSWLPAPLGKTQMAACMVCLFWPFIVFLHFVKQGVPSFTPSVAEAGWTAVSALAPIVYVTYRIYG